MVRPATRPNGVTPAHASGVRWRARRRITTPPHYALAGTVGALLVGRHDPTAQLGVRDLWRASRTPDGPGTVHLCHEDAALTATGYGPGGRWLVDRAHALAGLHHETGTDSDGRPVTNTTGTHLAGQDDFSAVVARDPVVAVLARRHPGLRLPRSELVFQELLATVLQQKVTWIEASRSYGRLLRHFGEPAPGPVPLLLPPDPASVAATPYWAFHPMGIEQKRADTLRRAAAVADRLEETVTMSADDADRRLRSIPGIGAWTVGELGRLAYGDPDAVSVGDYHLPHQVAYTLAGEPRADDARMLELLGPFAGHRGRVVRLIVAGGSRPPKRGPRRPIRSFARS